MASGPRIRRARVGRGVVLADVDPVGPHLEGQIGSVVQDEGHAVVGADSGGEPGPLDQGAGVEFLVPQLDDVHPAARCRREEAGEVGTVARAEIEVPPRATGPAADEPVNGRPTGAAARSLGR